MTTILLINQPLISSVTIIKEEAAIQKNPVLCHQFTDNPTFTVLLLLVHQSYTRKDNGLNIKRIRKYDSTLSCFILSDRLRYWHASESRINGDMMEIQPPAPGILGLCPGASQWHCHSYLDIILQELFMTTSESSYSMRAASLVSQRAVWLSDGSLLSCPLKNTYQI